MCPIWGYSGNAASLLPNTTRCPLLAQSGHAELHCTCPLSGVKRTCRFALQMSAFDPKRTCNSQPPHPAAAATSLLLAIDVLHTIQVPGVCTFGDQPLSSLRRLARFSLVAELMKGTANWNTWRRAFNFGCGASGR